MVVYGLFTLTSLASFLIFKNKFLVISVLLILSLTVSKLFALPNVYLDLILVMMVLTIMQNAGGRVKVRVDEMTILILIYSLFLLINSFYSAYADPIKLRNYLLYLMLYPLFLNLSEYYRFSGDTIYRSMKVVFWLIFATFLIFLVAGEQWIMAGHTLGFVNSYYDLFKNGNPRFISVFWNVFFVASTLMVLVFVFMYRRNYVFMGLSMIMLAATQFRAGLLVIVAIVFLYFANIALKQLMRGDGRIILKIFSAVYLSLLLTVTALLVMDERKQQYLGEKLNVNRFVGDVFSMKFFKERMHNWENAGFIMENKEYSLIMGLGVSASEKFQQGRYMVEDANYAKIIAEQGVLGFLLFLCFPLLMGIMFFKTKRIDKKAVAVAGIAYFSIGLTSNIINYYVSPHIIFSALGILNATKNKTC
jgi:hypothetical protein